MQTLRELRKQAGKTCAEVAEVLGVTPQAMYRYERGVREINLNQVVSLAKVYDVSIEEVVYASVNSQSVQ